jgi:catechol 2,3-dioxygenase-like lactoylglutathione lyase family enzyme
VDCARSLEYGNPGTEVNQTFCTGGYAESIFYANIAVDSDIGTGHTLRRDTGRTIFEVFSIKLWLAQGDKMQLNRVVTFLLTKNSEACIPFYRDVLGFRFLRDDGFALVFDLHGTMLRISKMTDFTPAQNTVLGWEVEDIGSAVGNLKTKGVAFQQYGMKFQDEEGIATFPNGDKVAWFKDPDGNVLSLSQHAAA